MVPASVAIALRVTTLPLAGLSAKFVCQASTRRFHHPLAYLAMPEPSLLKGRHHAQIVMLANTQPSSRRRAQVVLKERIRNLSLVLVLIAMPALSLLMSHHHAQIVTLANTQPSLRHRVPVALKENILRLPQVPVWTATPVLSLPPPASPPARPVMLVSMATLRASSHVKHALRVNTPHHRVQLSAKSARSRRMLQELATLCARLALMDGGK